MNVEFVIPGMDAMGRVFLTWTPVQAQARLVDGTGTSPVRVTLRSAGPVGGLRFATTRTHLGTPTLALNLPVSGAPLRFFVAGEFGRPSAALGDAAIEARGSGSLGVLGRKPVTVRIRKNAQTLSAVERDRFLAAFGSLNGGGAGRFTDFRNMHVFPARREAHGNRGFFPWHRGYILDLERELQAIDPSVALPYWRFDQAAPNVFTRQFMGVPDNSGRVQFSPGHPFGTWTTNNVQGILRGRPPQPASLRNELQTIALGGAAPNATYARLDERTNGVEINPHGFAHSNFGSGFIIDIGTAARDPLFFMLHANVDRLWAKWQWIHRRTSPTEARAFAPAVPDRIGHRLADTMWPWNGVSTPPRPSSPPPGGGFAPSPTTTAPGNAATVRAMIDFQAVGGGNPLGFAYDDVPFEL